MSPPQFGQQDKIRCGIYIITEISSEDKCANENYK